MQRYIKKPEIWSGSVYFVHLAMCVQFSLVELGTQCVCATHWQRTKYTELQHHVVCNIFSPLCSLMCRLYRLCRWSWPTLWCSQLPATTSKDTAHLRRRYNWTNGNFITSSFFRNCCKIAWSALNPQASIVNSWTQIHQQSTRTPYG